MKGRNISTHLNLGNGHPDIIRIDSDAFEKLLDAVIEYAMDKYNAEKNIWINEQQVLDLIGITSKTTLMKLRQEGKIKYTQPYARKIMYSKQSVLDFLEKHV